MTDEEAAGLDILEEAGVAFDPTVQYLDLTKDEKRRTTALLMAISAYKELIIREADYLKEAAALAARDEGPKLQPATIDAMVDAAIKFDDFIAGSAKPIPEESVELPTRKTKAKAKGKSKAPAKSQT